jgi:D-alanyl-D-alanine carboxypeptidase
MRRRWVTILVTSAVLSGVGLTAAPATATPAPATSSAWAQERSGCHRHAHATCRRGVSAQLDAALAEQVEALGLVGAVVAVDTPGPGRYRRAFGLADADTGEAMTTHHRVGIASVAKTFTAVALLRLADQGRLSLDDPIDRYVDGVPGGDRITIRHLLGMRSGLFDHLADEALLAEWDADPLLPAWRPADVVAILQRNEQPAEPDTVTAYTNVNYVLAGLVLERVTGRPAAEAIEHLVTAPLGLHRTALQANPERPAPSTRGYLRLEEGGELVPMPPNNPNVVFTAGSMVSTVDDLARWSRALSRGALLSPRAEHAQRQFTPLEGTPVDEGTGYGLGLVRVGDWLGHDGVLFGETTMMFTNVRTGMTVVVAANTMAFDHEAPPAAALFGTIVAALDS